MLVDGFEHRPAMTMMNHNPPFYPEMMESLGFPDVSAAIQRSNERNIPIGLFGLLIESKRTRWIALNGTCVLPAFQCRGGKALLYSEMEKTMREFNYLHADLTQVAESASQMCNDLENVGGVAYKNHRVFVKNLD